MQGLIEGTGTCICIMAWIQLARVELIVAMATGHLEVFWQQLPGTDKGI